MLNLKYCPNCGKKTLSYVDNKKWSCSSCNFTLYNNVAAAVGLIIIIKKDDNNHVLLVKRGREPQKGLLAVPGGFVDPGESAEEAGKREALEEIGLQINNLIYLTSATNNYKYKEIDYVTCDIFFKATVNEEQNISILNKLKAIEKDEIIGYELCKIETLEDIDKIPLAFKSAKVALSKLFIHK